jgi:hypothetical protein
MTRKAIIESSERGRIEIDYSAMSMNDLEMRIQEYERKYGMPFSQFDREIGSDSGSPYEMQDLMDWDALVQERTSRKNTHTSSH